MKKYPPSPKKATAQTVVSYNIIAYGIFRFHEGMPICRFHELSHTFASLLISQNVPLINVSNFLGHSDLATTSNIYAHLDKESKQASADIMTDILNMGKE